MKVRRGTNKDFEEIWQIEIEDRIYHKKITRKEYSQLNKSKIDKKARIEFLKWRQKDLKDKNKMFLIAEEDNKIMGHIGGHIFKWIWSDNPPKVFNIDTIGVLSKYKKKGIATKLIKELEKMLKKKGVKFTYLGVWGKNKPANKLYKKNNYKTYRTEMVKKIIP